MRRGIDHHAGRLCRIVAVEDFKARAHRCVGIEEEHPSLDRSAVLASRDDFLSRIAALLEVDATDQLEVQHLRHEPVDRCRFDRRDAALHLEPAPLIERHRRRVPGHRVVRRPMRRRSARCPPHRAGESHGGRPCRAWSMASTPASGRSRWSRSQPVSRISSLASLSLHWARSTNIDSRFNVGARRSAAHARRRRRQPLSRR